MSRRDHRVTIRQMADYARQEVHKALSAAITSQEKSALGRQIAATDMQIGRLVYDLYDLTEDEIKIVEGEDEAPPPPLPLSPILRTP